LNAVFF